MTEFQKYPHIDHWRVQLPTYMAKVPDNTNILLYIKLHGTHSDVVMENGQLHFQSRNNIVTEENDSFGIAKFCEERKEAFANLMHQIMTQCGPAERIILSGEFCGMKIQKRVALNQIPLTWVILGIKVDDQWQDMQKLKNVHDIQNNIRNITEAPVYKVKFCKDQPQRTTDEIRKIVEEIDKECPFVKTLYNLSGVGEGVVGHPEGMLCSSFLFKMKGDSHTITPPKTMEYPKELSEAKKTLLQFIEKEVTMERIDQANQANLDISENKMANVIGWIQNDILREEKDCVDEMLKKGGDKEKFTKKYIRNMIAKRVKELYE